MSAPEPSPGAARAGDAHNSWRNLSALPTVLLGLLAYLVLMFLHPEIFWFERLWAATLVGVVVGVPLAWMHSLRRTPRFCKAAICTAILWMLAPVVGVPVMRRFRRQERALYAIRAIGRQHLVRVVIKRDGAAWLDERDGERLNAMSRALTKAFIWSPSQTPSAYRIEVIIYPERGVHYLKGCVYEPYQKDAFVRPLFDDLQVILPDFLSHYP